MQWVVLLSHSVTPFAVLGGGYDWQNASLVGSECTQDLASGFVLRYLEEALAQGYGLLRVEGLHSALQAFRFPITHGYVTLSRMAAEGQVLGTIVLGGTLFHVTVSQGAMPLYEVPVPEDD